MCCEISRDAGRRHGALSGARSRRRAGEEVRLHITGLSDMQPPGTGMGGPLQPMGSTFGVPAPPARLLVSRFLAPRDNTATPFAAAPETRAARRPVASCRCRRCCRHLHSRHRYWRAVLRGVVRRAPTLACLALSLSLTIRSLSPWKATRATSQVLTNTRAWSRSQWHPRCSLRARRCAA